MSIAYLPITSLDSGLVFERDDAILRPRVHADARTARLLRLHPLSATGSDSAIRYARSTISISRSSSPRIAISAATASATRIRLTLAVTTRLLDPQQRRRARALCDRAALLFRGPAGDAERSAAHAANTSDVLLSGEGRLSDYWSAAGSLDYNLGLSADRAIRLRRYAGSPPRGRVLNAELPL